MNKLLQFLGCNSTKYKDQSQSDVLEGRQINTTT